MQALSGAGFKDRVITAKGPRTGHKIAVETPTNVMALIEFASGAQVIFCMSWDVWKHGHPPIELYGAEGSLRIPDPNFFGGMIEFTEKGGDWTALDSASKPFGAPNWRSPNWPPEAPDRANYRALGLAEIASAVATGAPHRASGRLALHVLEVMHAILRAGECGSAVHVESSPERPPAMTDDEAAALWRGGA